MSDWKLHVVELPGEWYLVPLTEAEYEKLQRVISCEVTINPIDQLNFQETLDLLTGD